MNKIVLVAASISGLLGLACACQPNVGSAPAQTTTEPQATSCRPEDCGPLPRIARICADGSTGKPQCARSERTTGIGCAWEHVCPDVAAAAAQTSNATTTATAPADKPALSVVESTTAFAQRLYGKLDAAPGNLFFSPLSISAALAMTYAGARGETAAQIAQALSFDLPPADLHPSFAELLGKLQQAPGTSAPELRIANRLWGQAGAPVEPEFLKITKDQYGAGIELVDFKSAAERSRALINAWVEQQTNKKIVDLLPRGSVDPLTRLVLTNAVYFKGRWATPFDKKATQSAPFTVKPGVSHPAPMMQHRKLRAGFGELPDASVLELAYQASEASRALSLVVILPKALDGLPAIEASISAGQLGGYLGALRAEQLVNVALPRFKLTSEHDLVPTLVALGMPLAFDPEKADFSGITGAALEKRLFISQVRHKAYVDVNEEGTEAAAATGVVMSTRSLGPDVPVFRADHPFAFLIRDGATGVVLFMGRVADPR